MPVRFRGKGLIMFYIAGREIPLGSVITHRSGREFIYHGNNGQNLIVEEKIDNPVGSVLWGPYYFNGEIRN